MDYNNHERVLYDYLYIGTDYYERARVAKKLRRWQDRLQWLSSKKGNAFPAY